MRTLKDLKIGETATVTEVGGEGALRQHFLDMGLIPGTEVTMVKYAPLNDPVEVRLHGYSLTLRLADAAEIGIDGIHAAEDSTDQPKVKKPADHPGSRVQLFVTP